MTCNKGCSACLTETLGSLFFKRRELILQFSQVLEVLHWVLESAGVVDFWEGRNLSSSIHGYWLQLFCTIKAALLVVVCSGHHMGDPRLCLGEDDCQKQKVQVAPVMPAWLEERYSCVLQEYLCKGRSCTSVFILKPKTLQTHVRVNLLFLLKFLFNKSGQGKIPEKETIVHGLHPEVLPQAYPSHTRNVPLM